METDEYSDNYITIYNGSEYTGNAMLREIPNFNRLQPVESLSFLRTESVIINIFLKILRPNNAFASTQVPFTHFFFVINPRSCWYPA